MNKEVMYWSDLANLTHATQVEKFGFCTCEDGESVYADCPQERERDYVVQFVGDFGVVMNTAEGMCCQEQAVEFARAQLMEHHGIDPLACGFTDVRCEVQREYAI